jgi:hypothetical protein
VTAEAIVCNEIGCEEVFEVGRGGKVQSSSWLLAAWEGEDLKE